MSEALYLPGYWSWVSMSRCRPLGRMGSGWLSLAGRCCDSQWHSGSIETSQCIVDPNSSCHAPLWTVDSIHWWSSLQSHSVTTPESLRVCSSDWLPDWWSWHISSLARGVLHWSSTSDCQWMVVCTLSISASDVDTVSSESLCLLTSPLHLCMGFHSLHSHRILSCWSVTRIDSCDSCISCSSRRYWKDWGWRGILLVHGREAVTRAQSVFLPGLFCFDHTLSCSDWLLLAHWYQISTPIGRQYPWLMAHGLPHMVQLWSLVWTRALIWSPSFWWHWSDYWKRPIHATYFSWRTPCLQIWEGCIWLSNWLPPATPSTHLYLD